MRWRSSVLASLFALAASGAAAEVDFYDDLAASPAVEAAVVVAAEGAALSAVERAMDGLPVTPQNRPARDRLTDLLARQSKAAVRAALRAHLAAAMSEEQAAALVDLAATPEGGALVEAAMLAALALRQEAGRAAEREAARAAALIESIRAQN